jgi:general secretion pathway protein A
MAWYGWQVPRTANAPATAAAPQAGPPATGGAPAVEEPATNAGPEPIITARTTPLSEPVTDSLLMVDGDESFDAAMGRLFQVWGAPMPNPADVPCEQASRFGLECLSVLGSLRELRHLDRPAVVKLTIAGLEHYLVVRRLEDETVELVSSKGRYLLKEDDLLYSWDGRFSLLWKMPPGYRLVRRGDSGATVDWLSRQLALVDGEPAVTTTVNFDENLERRLKRFQISVGLRPDGIAGERTWIHLNSATGTDVPRLAPATGDA